MAEAPSQRDQWFKAGRKTDPVLGVAYSKEAHEQLWPTAVAMYDDIGAERRALADDSLQLYTGADDALMHSLGLGAEPPGINLVNYCVDTKTAHIVHNKVRPLFVTDKGDAQLQAKAKAMQRAVEAHFTEAELYGEVGMSLCFDGNTFDAGAIKTTPDYANMRVLTERIRACDVLVDPRETKYGKPRQMIHVYRCDRDVALAFFANAGDEVIEAIKMAKPAYMSDHTEEYGEDTTSGQVADQILLVEAWHLPSGRVDTMDRKSFGYGEDGFDANTDPGHDGRHAIVIEDCTLLFEPWPFDYFPISLFRPMKRRVGYWSRGLPEVLAGVQIAINRMNARIDGIMHLHARPLLYLWRQARVNKGKITNDWASIIEGNAPAHQAMAYITPQAVPSEYIRRVQELISWGEKQAGLSELSINAAKPAGIEHAPALQHLADTEAIRHTPAFRAWEDVFLHCAKVTVDCYRLLAWHAEREGKDFEVVFGNSEELKKYNWKEIDIPADKYHLTVWPTNLLPQTPGARIARVIEMLRENMITPVEAKLMLPFPDLKAVMGDHVAERDNIDRKLQKAVEGGPDSDDSEWEPHPYLNLQLAAAMCKERINRLEADDGDEQAIENLRTFFRGVQEEMAKMAKPTPAPAPPMAAPGGPVAGPPGAPVPPGGPMPPMPPPGPGAPPPVG